MRRRDALLLGSGAALLGAGLAGWGGYGEAVRQAGVRLAGGSDLVHLGMAEVEYAIAGEGPWVMMIHGTGGGFDQGLLFATALRRKGYRILAPSRFGYLRSSFPEDASPARQADVLAALLDRLEVERLAVIGGSAGALSAAEFALRHPGRCSHLGLLVPAANLKGRDPVVFTAPQRLAVRAVLGSDLRFWALSRLATRRMIGTLLATDPHLLDAVGAGERQRALAILTGIFPVERKARGLAADSAWAGAPSSTCHGDIAVPTLILSCEDDRFGTAATARDLAARIPGARLRVFPTGGHIWLGRDGAVAEALDSFLSSTRPG
ncbi:alpha/beta fold hydrolase [Oceaniglobus roseus]|uniref:alpha/beta fold hydrolase n=1 Tax=Oceaniglobus roseus TaxID=1737570 RepID=UPI0012FFDA79|nr:alpha/beta hydrolase [Kandeliimicrobium roseum]